MKKIQDRLRRQIKNNDIKYFLAASSNTELKVRFYFLKFLFRKIYILKVKICSNLLINII